MRKNFLLIAGIIVAIVLVVNSARKIASFHSTSQEVVEIGERLNRLKEENEELKRELEYKKSDEFAEKEIRNKLGLAREGEAIVIVPKSEDKDESAEFRENDKLNWQKWKELFFGES